MMTSVALGLCIGCIGVVVVYWRDRLMSKVEALVCSLVMVPLAFVVASVWWEMVRR